MRSDTRKVHLQMTSKGFKLLCSVKERTDSLTYADTCKRALMVYNELLDCAEKNREFIMRDSDGKEILFPLSML